MPQRVLALELGAREFKAALVDASFRDYRIVGFHRAEIAADGRSKPDQLRHFLTTHGLLGATSVLTALPGDLVSWRSFFLPFRDRRRLDQTVPFELEGQVPFGLDEVVIDYHVLTRGKEGSRVLAALVRRSDLESHLGLLTEVGLDPKVVDVAPLVMLNVLRLLEKDLPPTFAYVGGTDDRITVAAVRDGELLGLRIVTPAPRSVEEVEAVSGGNGRPAEEPLREKSVLQDIRWTIMALSSQPLAPDAPCLVSGEGPLFDEICDSADSAFGLKGRRIKTGALEKIPSELRQHSDQFLTPIGLALREVTPNETMGVNFRRGEFAYHRAGEETRKALRRTLALAGVVIAFVVGHTFVEHQRLAARLGMLDAAVREVFSKTLDAPPSSDPAAQLQAEIDTLRKELEQRERVVPVDGSTTVDALREMSIAVLPTLEIDVDEFIMDTNQIRLKATSDSFESVDSIKQKVAATGYFGDVEVKNVKTGQEGNVDFLLLLDLGKPVSAPVGER